jgi:hypothetical protein
MNWAEIFINEHERTKLAACQIWRDENYLNNTINRKGDPK